MRTITESVDVNAPVQAGLRTRDFNATITEQHPDERVAWKSEDGPNHAGVITFHRLDEQTTRVTAQMDIDPESFVETVADKFGVVGHRVKGDMRRFQELMESRGAETGGWRGEVDRPQHFRANCRPSLHVQV